MLEYRDCENCIHYSLCNYEEICHYDIDNIKNAKDCSFFQDRSRFVELPFEQNKGASPFDKVAHTTYTLATESHRVASFTIEGYYLMYNEERLYTLEKDGIVILVQGSSPHDVVEKAKLAIEKLSKERESNA